MREGNCCGWAVERPAASPEDVARYQEAFQSLLNSEEMNAELHHFQTRVMWLFGDYQAARLGLLKGSYRVTGSPQEGFTFEFRGVRRPFAPPERAGPREPT